MKERFLNLAASCALAAMTFATPAVLAAEDCCYQQPDNCYTDCNYCDEQCISVFADYLYWNVCPSSLSFATEARSVPVRATAPSSGEPFKPNDSFDLVDPVNSLGGSQDHHVNTKYTSGFRVGFAYHMPDQWDLEVAYTYFHPTYKGHYKTASDTHFVPCGLPNYNLSIPIKLALQVPPQACTWIYDLTKTDYFDAAYLNGTGYVNIETGVVNGTFEGNSVLDCAQLVPPGADVTKDLLSALAPLKITGTQPTSSFLLTIPNTAFDGAKVNATLKYDLVDILFAKRYECGGCFDYVPYAGVRILSLEEDIHTHYSFETVVTSDSSSSPESNNNKTELVLRTRNKLKLPAGGLTFGSRMNYALCDCFNLFGSIGASILAGDAKLSAKWDNLLLNQALKNVTLPGNYICSGFVDSCKTADGPKPWTVTSNVEPTHRHRSHCQVVFGLDASLGIGYEWCFCSVPVLLGAGYEIQSWWNMPQHINAQSCGASAGSSFTVHGLFVRLGFGF